MNNKNITLGEWMTMDTQDVLDIFASLDRAIQIGSGNKQYVYVPGTKKNKVLLVSHSDTVFDTRYPKRDIEYTNGVYHSPAQADYGIGADDRAGCAILWKVRNLGHSLFIPNAEEIGCIGTEFAMSDPEFKKELNSHQFAIEFDRMNSSDLVGYSVGSNALEEYLGTFYKGYKSSWGSYTDIVDICKSMAGVNISIGYYGQHGANERLVSAEWQRTLDFTRNFLSQEDGIIPKFTIDPPKSYGRYGSYGFGANDIDYPSGNSWDTSPQRRPSATTVSTSISHNPIQCLHCECWADSAEIISNFSRCPVCHRITI